MPLNTRNIPLQTSLPKPEPKHARWRSHKKQLLAVLMLLTCSATERAQAANHHLELSVKAAFIYNFSKYVVWPEAEMDDNRAMPITICVAADHHAYQVFADTVADKISNGRRVITKRAGPPLALNDCQFLYISGEEATQDWISRIGTAPVITVGEGEGFIDAGGIFEFVINNGRVRFSVNNNVAMSRHIRISSQLLSLALTALMLTAPRPL